MKKNRKLKIAGIIVASPIILFIVAVLLLYFPPFQNWAVKKVAKVASSSLGMQITVEHVNLEFPLNLGISGVKAIQQNDSLPQVKDTIADVQHAVANVQLWPLLHKQVEVDRLDLIRVKLNTANLVHKARVKGTVGRLHLESHGINLVNSQLKVNQAQLSNSNLDIALSDTVPPDTSKKPNYWKIWVNHLLIANTKVMVHTPGDTLRIGAGINQLEAGGGYFDLFKNYYKARRLQVNNSSVTYDNTMKTHTKGLDVNHIALSGVWLGISDFSYLDPKIAFRLNQCKLREKSGIEITKLTGPFSMDSTQILLPALSLRTPESSIDANVHLDLSAFNATHPGLVRVVMEASLGKDDLMRWMGSMPYNFRLKWPNAPLSIKGILAGNTQKAIFRNVYVNLPTALGAHFSGWLSNFTSPKHLKGEIKLLAHTGKLDFITALLPASVNKMINIPHGIVYDGTLHLNGSNYASTFRLAQGGGTLAGSAAINTDAMAYKAQLKAHRLPLQHFVPHYGLSPFSGTLAVNGRGTDPFNRRTHIAARAAITQFNYGKYNLANIKANALIANSKAHVNLDSRNNLMYGVVQLVALLSHKPGIMASVGADVKHIDLYGLHLVDKPLTASMCGHVDLASDMKYYNKVQGLFDDITINEGNKAHRPEGVMLDVLTLRDSTHAIAECGDFHLDMDANQNYKKLLSQSTRLTNELMRQVNARLINETALRRVLPSGHLILNTGSDNFFAKTLKHFGYVFKNADINITSSPVNGLQGSAALDSLVLSKDSVRLDTIRLDFASGANNMAFNLRVQNNANNYPSFTALANGEIHNGGTTLTANLYDYKNRLGISLPLAATMDEKGIRLEFKGSDPVLGYKTFKANDGGYVLLQPANRISANLTLTAADGQGAQLVSNDDNTDALQDLTLSLYKLDLSNLVAVLPYTPNITGVMNGDFHMIQTTSDLSVSSDVNVNDMTYEGCKMGNVGTEFVYIPKADGTHNVNGILMSNDKEVAQLSGLYSNKDGGYLDASVNLEEFPLNLVNGFIPEQLFGFEGKGEGTLTVKGSLSKPDVNGEVYLDSSYIESVPYGVKMRFANDPVTITNSHLLFENFEMFASNNQPLDMSGYFDFSNLDNMLMNVKMQARNFQIIDAKENPRSEAFGKAFVNFYGLMQGPVDDLNFRGRMDVLSSTDMTYVLRDNLLTTDNQLDELVKFTNLNDTIEDLVNRPPVKGMDMDLQVNIDESAHILCALNSDKSNYIDLMGGGDLRLMYDPVNSIRLTGKYTLNNGEMKYALPVIPLKTFDIQEGSYLQFTGNPMNPTLSITATEDVKSLVNEGEGNGRQVEFTTGVKLSQTLEKPGIEFIISAPNDITIQDQLNTMSVEERGKVAVTMLASGMYLVGGTSGFSMNSALNTFLNAQINNITGTALKSLGLDVGMSVDNTTTNSGLHTDYNFKFAKRFWNNRLSISIGGQVSSGAEINGQSNNNTFFNQAELQYRLNSSSSQYLRAFFNNNAYDWLEGQIGEYGGGFLWKRKLRHFKDIFRLKDDTEQMPKANTSDSTRSK